MMTREERSRRMLAKFDEMKDKFYGREELGSGAFTAFCEGYAAGHAIGLEEAGEIFTEKLKPLLESKP